jgi:phthalate 4,5-dioxygenase oxygenase subunit
MLSAEENETLTRTGSGTPMGELLRRFWLPALLPDELPRSDCAPVEFGCYRRIWWRSGTRKEDWG